MAAAVAGRHDHAARRLAQRRGREKGCWVYIPAALLRTDAWPIFYRVWGGQRSRYVVTLYDRP